LFTCKKTAHYLFAQDHNFNKNKNMTTSYWQQATQELAVCDKTMHHLIQSFEGAILTSRGCAFTTLARSIVGQQISVKAAESIWQEIINAVSDITPHTIASVEQDLLRVCGLSARKINYLQDLSRHLRMEC
jgi:DNA-3-methyladenine glycosylase II